MMSMHDRYYEPEDNNDAEEFAEKVDYELKNDNYPYSPENISECFHDDGFEGSWETLATLLQQGDTAAAGIVLSATLYSYWEARTEREVEENL